MTGYPFSVAAPGSRDQRAADAVELAMLVRYANLTGRRIVIIWRHD